MSGNRAPDCNLLAMYRASVRGRSGHRYQQLLDEEAFLDPSELKSFEVPIKLKRVASSPVGMIIATAKFSKSEITVSSCPQKAKTSRKDAKAHPLLSFFSGPRRKKAAVKPEFIRYLEYMKEGGRWDARSNRPVIYFN